MNKYKLPASIFLLFLIFFVGSRYIQKILFDRDLSNTLIHKALKINPNCKPKEDSILGHYKKTGKSVLFIMIDSYPEESYYKNLIKSESLLHNYLSSNSDEYQNLYTPIPYTYKSVPFLLGKIDVNDKCRFPFMNGYFKPNLILASGWSSSMQSICKEHMWFYDPNFFRKLYTFLKLKVNGQDQIYLGKDVSDENCFLSSKTIPEKVIKKMEENLANSKKISFLSESKFHDVIDPNLTGKKADLNLLKSYDNLYFESIKKIVNLLRKKNLVDEIIIFSDHGPRTKIYGEIKFSTINTIKDKLKGNSFLDKDYFGIFASRIIISETDNLKNEDVLNNFLPKTNKRYINDEYGNAVFIKDLSK